MRNFTYGSVCSGIEAASVAWHPLGWKPAWFAEIEPFPSAVLAHRFPTVANLGDMTKIATLVRAGVVDAPDVLVGGTPCQAFSVAGVRQGLADPRGQLTLAYADLANAIDEQRPGNECVIYWENVPGVLSDKTNAFGCFLAILAGENDALIPAGGKWSNAGCVYGPQRAIAWRVLDAQYFGVAQRRRRVFVVASARKGFNPAAILFESEGVRRDTAPSRKPREAVTRAATLGTFGCLGIGQYASTDSSPTIKASGADYGHGCESLISYTDTLCMAHGQAGAEIGHDLAPTLTTVHEAPITAYCSEITSALCAADGPKGVSDQYAHEGKLIVQKDIVGAITARYGGNAMGAPEVDAGLYIPVNVAYGFQPRIARNGRGDMGDVVSALTAQAGEDGTGRGQPIVAATREIAQTITSNYGKQIDNTDSALGPNVALHGMAVRRLTPRECERLQGFPDNWTLVPVKGKPAADGPRYKALGNSMAVPCMRWLGYRLILTHSEYGIK